MQALGDGLEEDSPDRILLRLLDRPDWREDPRIAAGLRDPLLRLCGRYLLEAHAPSGRALDPVAHFHLSNGARVERLNWLGDVSEKGLQQSAGLMVNYLYDLKRLDKHREMLAQGRMAAAPGVAGLAFDT